MVKMGLLCNEIAGDFLFFYLQFKTLKVLLKEIYTYMYKYMCVNIFKLTITHIYILS